MLDPRNLVVHVKTQEEACDVVAWFEDFGFQRNALNPGNYLQYPFIHVNNRKGNLLTGSNNIGACPENYDQMEYDEWRSCIDQESDSNDPIDDEAFICLINASK